MGLQDKRDSLLARDGNHCPECGVELIPDNMSFEHIVPYSAGGDDSIGNLRLICKTCNARLANRGWDSARGVDFVAYLTSLMKGHPKFSLVESSKAIRLADKSQIVDIYTEDSLNVKLTRRAFVIKTSSIYSASRRQAIVNEMKVFSRAIQHMTATFAVMLRVTEDEKAFFVNEGIEVWGIDEINAIFSEQIASTPHPAFQKILGAAGKRESRPEELLRSRLLNCKPGKQAWPSYQRLVGEILELCFVPDLSVPISELSDNTGTNRRDFIFPNYAETGFWAYLRQRYVADHIVVDAKNHGKHIGKGESLQIANYLRPHGVGLFGIIVTRYGPDAGCQFTLREIWATDKKMIIVLNDQDVESMLTAFGSGTSPESVRHIQIISATTGTKSRELRYL